LHVHLVGSLQAATLGEFAHQAGLPLPRPVAELYRYRSFYDFIEIFRLAAQSMRSAAQFERALYEYVARSHRESALAHVEFFFNPSYHAPFGVSYRTQLEGLVSGAQAAERDFGVSVLLIPSIDREFGPELASQVLDEVLAVPDERVVGIGLDGPEDRGPPPLYAAVFARAGRAGLRRTAHVCEDYAATPADNYRLCRDLLGCDRYDHGYRLLGDAALVAHAREDGASFTCCPKPSTREREAMRLAAIEGLFDAGLGVSLATDDPAMFETNLTDAYRRFIPDPDLQRLKRLCEAGIAASWAAPERKIQLREQFAAWLVGTRLAPRGSG
jgi:adenosine deaminase